MQIRLPFHRRITLAFVIMTVAVSGAFSLGIVGTVIFVEHQIVSDDLNRELDVVLHEQKETGHTPRLDQKTRFYTSGSAPQDVQEEFEALEYGLSEVVNPEDAFYVFKKNYNGVNYFLVQEEEGFESRQHTLFHATIAGFLSCIVCSWLIGSFMARRIMAPVTKLSRAVRQLDLHNSQPALLTPHYGTDEIGQLSIAFDNTYDQLRRSLDREQLFTSDVSHELRTPLMVIASSYELLKESPLTPLQQKQLDRIGRSATEMRNLVQTFLLLARNKAEATLTGNQVTLAQAALETAEVWGELIRQKGLEFFMIGDMSGQDRYDKILLGTIISNLLRNAKHYTEQGSVRLVLEEKGFRVEDSGVGINEEEMATLFEPFVRGPRARGEGLGLGLSLVKRICVHQDWRIEVSKLDSGGSCFRVQLGPDAGNA